MTNSRLIFTLMAFGAIICGVVGAIAAIGTSVLLPGLGLVIAGPIAGGIIGAIFGSVSGLVTAAVIIVIRGKTYP